MRYRLVLSLLLILLLAGVALAQEPSSKTKPPDKKSAAGPASKEDVPALLESNIRSAWAAFKNKNKPAYGEFLADDFIAVEADGEGTRSRGKVLREVEQSMVQEYTLSFIKVKPLGPDAAYVTYECTIQFPPKSVTKFERVYITEIWAKRNGQWKTLHYQETRVK